MGEQSCLAWLGAVTTDCEGYLLNDGGMIEVWTAGKMPGCWSRESGAWTRVQQDQ